MLVSMVRNFITNDVCLVHIVWKKLFKFVVNPALVHCSILNVHPVINVPLMEFAFRNLNISHHKIVPAAKLIILVRPNVVMSNRKIVNVSTVWKVTFPMPMSHVVIPINRISYFMVSILVHNAQLLKFIAMISIKMMMMMRTRMKISRTISFGLLIPPMISLLWLSMKLVNNFTSLLNVIN